MTIDKTQLINELINNMKLSGYYSEVNIKLNDLSEGELNLISNFAPIIASKSKPWFSDTYNLDGKEIFDKLMKQDIKDLNTKEKLNLILNFAPMIISMVTQYASAVNNTTGKKTFYKLMTLNTAKLSEINNSYNECKKGDDQKQCHNKIIEQIRNA